MYRYFAVFCLLVAFAQSIEIKYKSCGGSGEFKGITVTPCEKEPCTIKFNADTAIVGQVNTKKGAKKPSLKVEVDLGNYYGNPGIFAEYPWLEADICGRYLQCPLKAGTDTAFKINFGNLYWLPPIQSTTVRFRLFESNGGQELACAEANVAIA